MAERAQIEAWKRNIASMTNSADGLTRRQLRPTLRDDPNLIGGSKKPESARAMYHPKPKGLHLEGWLSLPSNHSYTNDMAPCQKGSAGTNPELAYLTRIWHPTHPYWGTRKSKYITFCGGTPFLSGIVSLQQLWCLISECAHLQRRCMPRREIIKNSRQSKIA